MKFNGIDLDALRAQRQDVALQLARLDAALRIFTEPAASPASPFQVGVPVPGTSVLRVPSSCRHPSATRPRKTRVVAHSGIRRDATLALYTGRTTIADIADYLKKPASVVQAALNAMRLDKLVDGPGTDQRWQLTEQGTRNAAYFQRTGRTILPKAPAK